jgi:hypothetical protein
MGQRLRGILAKPVDNLMYVWLVTIGIIVGLGFAGAVALLYAPK